MWTLDYCPMDGEWTTLGTFATVTDAAIAIRDREGEGSPCFRFFLDFKCIKETDPDYLEHQALSGSYVVYSDQRREAKP